MRDRELDSLEEKCRGLTQQLKAALDAHVMVRVTFYVYIMVRIPFDAHVNMTLNFIQNI